MSANDQASFNQYRSHLLPNSTEYSTDSQVDPSSLSALNQQKNGKYKMPFMRYWDEHSEIQNYGLFGPQPVSAEINTSSALNDAASSNHSGLYFSMFKLLSTKKFIFNRWNG